MSLLYLSHPLYEFCMRTIYGKGFDEKNRAAADLIPQNASVLDLCAGDACIYRHYLKQKNVKYLGLDQSRDFEKFARKEGIPFETCDLQKNPELPEADYVLMLSSLYQFIPHEHDILQAMIRAAKKAVIICEPIKNLAQSKNWGIRTLAKALTYPHVNRFDKQSLTRVFEELKFNRMVEISGGREMLGVLERS